MDMSVKPEQSNGMQGMDPNLYNEDLAPVTKEKRNWDWINFSTVWMGMVHNIVAYETAGSLLGLGMSVWQALATVIVANIVLIVAMWLNGIAGAKYGLPFPVLIRASFGYKGAHIPVLIRAFVAIFWFAVQAYAGSKAVGAVLGVLIPGWNSLEAYHFLGMGLNEAIAVALFWILHAYIISHGIERVKFFELWAGPLVIVLGLGLVICDLYGARLRTHLCRTVEALEWRVLEGVCGFRDRACRSLEYIGFKHTRFYEICPQSTGSSDRSGSRIARYCYSFRGDECGHHLRHDHRIWQPDLGSGRTA
jgi:cytosine/uracil/thiamine/allantoin permease